MSKGSITEEWRDIPEYIGVYQASTLGRVRSLDRKDSINHFWKGRVLKPQDRGNGYIYYELNLDGQAKKVLAHRLVGQVFLEDFTESCIIDHIDGNPLNNQIWNIRVSDKYTNQHNRKAESGCTSKFKGVSLCLHNEGKPWRMAIKPPNGKRISKSFRLEVDAARHYDMLAVIYFGEFALTNEMMGLYDD